jgi:hypothetical protein
MLLLQFLFRIARRNSSSRTCIKTLRASCSCKTNGAQQRNQQPGASSRRHSRLRRARQSLEHEQHGYPVVTVQRCASTRLWPQCVSTFINGHDVLCTMLMHRKPLPVTRCDAAAATAADARRVSVPSKLLLVLQSATHWTRPDRDSTGEVWLLQSSSMWNENQPPSVMFLGGSTTKLVFLAGMVTLPMMKGVTRNLAMLATCVDVEACDAVVGFEIIALHGRRYRREVSSDWRKVTGCKRLKQIRCGADAYGNSRGRCSRAQWHGENHRCQARQGGKHQKERSHAWFLGVQRQNNAANQALAARLSI